MPFERLAQVRRVVLLGETHYVQEHQQFVLGLRDDYPDSVRRMDEYWIEGLRSFNAELPESERIRVRYIDMNHAHDALGLSLWWMAGGTTAGEHIGPLVAVVCPKCGWKMKVIAVIRDSVEIRDILAHLVKTGRALPGFDPALLN